MAGELVAAGAQFGPWGAVAGGVAEVGMAAMGGSAGPSSADAIFGTNLQFDNSGWNVNFGSGEISSTSDKTTSQGGAGGLSGNMSSYLPYALIFVGGLVAWKMLKK